MKDLFYVVSSAFKADILKLSEQSIAEVGEHIYQNVAEPMSQAHHQQVMVWNHLMNTIGSQFSQGILAKNEQLY